jgi:hypothetical protein
MPCPLMPCVKIYPVKGQPHRAPRAPRRVRARNSLARVSVTRSHPVIGSTTLPRATARQCRARGRQGEFLARAAHPCVIQARVAVKIAIPPVDKVPPAPVTSTVVKVPLADYLSQEKRPSARRARR